MKFESQIIYFAGGFGGWSTRGCFLREESDTNATCECSHLTNFGILVVHIRHFVHVLDYYVHMHVHLYIDKVRLWCHTNFDFAEEC